MSTLDRNFTKNQKFWVDVYNRFELDEPVIDSQLRARREYSPRQDIVKALQKPYGRTKRRFLMIGTVGTGKTTELFAIAEDVASTHFVVLLDIWRHYDELVGNNAALQHIEPWEILLLVGLAVYKAAQVRFGHVWRQSDHGALASAIKDFFPTSGKDGPGIDLASLANSLVAWASGVVGDATTAGLGTGLKLLSKVTESTKWELPLLHRSGRKAIPEEDPRVDRLLKAVNGLLHVVERDYRKVALFLDGLDRITEQQTTRDIFTESRLLTRIDCNMVLTGPIALRQDGIAHMVYGVEPKVLANVPVLRREDPTQHGAGVLFMRELFRRRIADLPPPPGLTDTTATIPPDLLARLAYYSGGRARDFIRLIRNVADRAFEADLAVVSGTIVDECIDERRRVIELGITRADVDILQLVGSDEKHLLPNDPRIADLLNRWLLLPYPNESEWYFPHPLLTLKLVNLR